MSGGHAKRHLGSPRLIHIAKVQAPGLYRTAAVARTTNADSPGEQCDDFWNELGVRTKQRKVYLLLVDTNATAGEEMSTSIGDYGKHLHDNRAGNEFHAYLRERNERNPAAAKAN